MLFDLKEEVLHKMIRGKEGWIIGVMGAMLLMLVLFCGFSLAADESSINAAPYLREGREPGLWLWVARQPLLLAMLQLSFGM
jgi:hypothetical protein